MLPRVGEVVPGADGLDVIPVDVKTGEPEG